MLYMTCKMIDRSQEHIVSVRSIFHSLVQLGSEECISTQIRFFTELQEKVSQVSEDHGDSTPKAFCKYHCRFSYHFLGAPHNPHKQ